MKNRFAAVAGAVVALGCCLTPAIAQSEGKAPRGEIRPMAMDSGLRGGEAVGHSVAYRELIMVHEAAWLRLYFGEDSRIEPGSFLRIQSLLDGEVQEMDASDLVNWDFSTAYFNGAMLLVELVAGPGTTGNRLVIERVGLELAVHLETGSCGICGPDNRLPSSMDFACRLMPVGCSASVFNEESCLVSAGHCMGVGLVAQFQVPASQSNCNLVNPPISEQFPITDLAFQDTGVGGDWAVCKTGNNNLGQSAYERYGMLRPIAAGSPGIGQFVEIWGYGIDDECVRNQVQQRSAGSVTGVWATYFEHNADATFGNSGSAIIVAGQIMGINSHCPCNNVATRVSHPAFAAAIEDVCPEPLPTGACCFISGVCNESSAEECTVAGGYYRGDGTGCPDVCDDLGACCIGTSCTDVNVATCDLAGGVYETGGSCSSNPCAGDCPFDVDDSGTVDFNDLVEMLASWGNCPGCPADADGDGDVDFDDLVGLLAAWGAC